MKWIIENWSLLVVIVSIATVAFVCMKRFGELPPQEQVYKVKQWLLYAVIEAEREFSGGTGVLKLRYVYDLFVKAFPSLTPLVPFDIFRIWVDEALEQMKHLIDTNKSIDSYITGETDV